MKNFKYIKPKGLEELLQIKKDRGKKALLLAGGTNLLVYIRDGELKEGAIVDITALKELKGIQNQDGTVEIGAAETMASLLNSEVLRKTIPFIPEILRDFANPLVRSTSTIGGNIADASPIADAAPPLMVLNAEVVGMSASGERTIPLDEFFINPRETHLKPDEVLLKFRIPIPKEGMGKFIKLGLRRGTSCSVTSVAVWLVFEGEQVKDIRIALGGVAPRPLRAKKTEAAFKGKRLDTKTIDQTAEAVAEDISPITDVRGSGAYRQEVSARILARAVKICARLEE